MADLPPAASIAHLSLSYLWTQQDFNLSLLPANLRTLHIKVSDHEHCIPPVLEDYINGRHLSLS